MRPTFTTGWPPAKVRITAICRKTRKKSRLLSAECSAKLSAQSPPWSRKPLPSETLASLRLSFLASPAKTSGGKPLSVDSTEASFALSSYRGTCSIGSLRQLSGVHAVAIILLQHIRRPARDGREWSYTQVAFRPQTDR